MIPACPNCGARSWKIPAAVEVDLHVDDQAITTVTVEQYVMHGEGDPRCTRCGELLLDWSSRREDDDAWNTHHDERRPAWDELHETTRDLPLPELEHWRIEANR